MEDDLKKNRRRPKKIEDDQKINKLEDDLKKNGRQPQAKFKKSTLIGCDIIVNQPSFSSFHTGFVIF